MQTKNELMRVNVMLNKPLIKELDWFARNKMEDRSTAIRQLLADALSSERIELGINKFKEGNITFREAADISGLDYWDFQGELDKRNIPVMRSITLAERRIKDMEKGIRDKE